MRINIPGIGLQDIDIEEIVERASTMPRPPLNKKRPKPKPPVNLEDALISKRPLPVSRPTDSPIISEGSPGGIGMGGTQLGERITGPDAFDAMFGKGKSSRPDVSVEIPETINIPGVGPIQLPNVQSKVDLVGGGINPSIGKRADGSTIRLMDPDAVDYIKSQEMYDPYAGYRNREGDGGWGERLNQDDVINENPVIGTRPDGSLVHMYDQDASEYWNKFEETTGETSQGPITQTETQTETETETETSPPPPPPINPFKGFVPGNIIGQSFDPKDLSAHQKTVADARARMSPGANIQGGGYLTYDNPILGNKQTQFGGYGQPMPTAPLMNYAGLASPITYSTPDPDPDKEIIR